MTATTLQRYYKVVAVYDKIIENEATHAIWLLFCRHVGYTLLTSDAALSVGMLPVGKMVTYVASIIVAPFMGTCKIE